MQKESGILPKKYILIAVVIALIFLSYTIIRPYITAIISAFILAFLIKPVYNYLEKRIGKTISAMLSVILILVAIVAPLALIITQLIQQLIASAGSITLSSINDALSNFPLLNRIDLSSAVRQLGTLLSEQVGSLLSAVPLLIVSLFILIIGTYYILKSWDKITYELKKYLPVKDKEKVSKEIGQVTNNIVYGYALIALIEFFIGGVGFFLSGVQFYILLPALIGIFAFIPGLGPIIIWAPTAAVYFLQGDIATAIGVTITGLIISIGIDNFFAPKIVGGRAKIHPLIMLIGILGGVTVFGIFGFIIGPLILTYTIKLLQETID